jgi:protein-S-isoprenylcysteine O-methyltransferase Ste14
MKSRIMPPAYFFVLLFLSIALHFLFPVAKIIYPPLTYTGFLLIAFGAVINIWADTLVKRAGTTVKPYKRPSKMIETGPFSISRNPQYLGFTAILLGVVALHGTMVMFIFPLLFVAVVESMFIPYEEKNLERAFGRKYLDYKNRVRRWV